MQESLLVRSSDLIFHGLCLTHSLKRRLSFSIPPLHTPQKGSCSRLQTQIALEKHYSICILMSRKQRIITSQWSEERHDVAR